MYIMLVIIVVGFVFAAASIWAVYSYGRFAEQSRGEPSVGILDNALFSSRTRPSNATGPPCSSITPVATLMTVVVVPVMIPIAFSPGVVAVATP